MRPVRQEYQPTRLPKLPENDFDLTGLRGGATLRLDDQPSHERWYTWVVQGLHQVCRVFRVVRERLLQLAQAVLR